MSEPRRARILGEPTRVAKEPTRGSAGEPPRGAQESTRGAEVRRPKVLFVRFFSSNKYTYHYH